MSSDYILLTLKTTFVIFPLLSKERGNARATSHKDGLRGRSDGSERDQYIWNRGKSVVVLCQDLEGNFTVLRQFKYGSNEEVWTLPAGGVKANESIIDAAIRELLEETGYSSTRWTILIPGKNPDGDLVDKSTGQHFYFLCTTANQIKPFSEGEGIKEVKAVDFQELMRMVATNELKGQAPKAAILHYLALLKPLGQKKQVF